MTLSPMKRSKKSDYISMKLKNIEKIMKKRGEGNVFFIDNDIYSYINRLECYIPVPKFSGKENSCLFFCKFYLENLNPEKPSLMYELIKALAH
jgi:TFIIF-interacting CTD phosphatase-like protein